MSKANSILVNGKVYSVLADNSEVHGTAVAIADGKILKVGTDEEIKALADDNTEIIDCKGNTILPGMCDAHCHPSIACASIDGVDLFSVYRREDQTADDVIDIYKERIRKYVEANPDKTFIRGAGWIVSNFNEKRWPNRHDLDEICADRPIVLESFCQHNIWVNTKALEIGGLDADTPDVETGEIVREEDHYPSGLFRDAAAMFTAKASIPGYNLTTEEFKPLLIKYMDEYASRYGVTMISDCMCCDEARQAYKELAEEGKLNVRLRTVNLMTPEDCIEQIPEFIKNKGKDNVGEDFRIDTVKVFAEGAFAMTEPYRDDYCIENNLPLGSNGELYYDDETFINCASEAMKAGFSVHVHAMGDASINQSAKCLAEAQKKAGIENTRSVITHLMLVSDEVAELMGKSHIIANVQPRWMLREDDVQAVVNMIGEKGEESYPFRKLVDAGCVWAASTDFPVTPPPAPMYGIHCWMNRTCFPTGFEWEKYQGRVLGNEEPATLAEAIKGLTWGGAYQMRMEDYAGTIEEGKSADLVIMDRDMENTPKEEMYSVDVANTFFKGKMVYEKQ
ncbi:MAG: amidohydrolase [Clostridia bacterium]|nr:amidohydrolase [Clostridia bacterium]